MAETGIKKLEMRFKFDVAETFGGANIKRCLACGACTGVCPARQANEEFDPRKIIHMVILGLKKSILSEPTIWNCLLCNSCSFVCPQDVRFSWVIPVLRQMAIDESYIGISFLKRFKEIEELSQRVRSEMLKSALAEKEVELEPKMLLEEAFKKCVSSK